MDGEFFPIFSGLVVIAAAIYLGLLHVATAICERETTVKFAGPLIVSGQGDRNGPPA